jgi:exodeoxyribonuclease VII large subunit
METNYDMIVIIRGGGSFEDLYGFSQPELIETIYNFKGPPILSAIGHMVDCPMIDSVTDASAPTPSLAGQFIVDHNNKYIMGLRKTLDSIKFDLIQSIDNKSKQITSYYSKLQYIVQNKMQRIKYNIYEKIKDTIHSDMVQLNRMEDKLNSYMVPQITLYNNKNKKKVENENMIHPNTIYCMRWKDKEWKIKIIENNLEE